MHIVKLLVIIGRVNMNNKYSKMIIFYVFCLCFIGLIGLSAAFFTSLTPSESASTIFAKGGSMNIKYDNKSANITVSNIYPKEDAWVTKKFQVIGNNTTDLLMFYKVKMVVDNNKFGLDLSYTLTGTNTSNSGELIPNVTNNVPIGLNNFSLGTGYHVKGTNKIHEYTLKIFLKPSDENQNYAQQANFAAHLVIEIDGTSPSASPSNWDKAGSNTLLAGIKKNYAKPTKTLTNPVTDISAPNEAVMSLAPDDYGISYYFRGNVQNNFVSFAGMCWRIVRIIGDGSIKLALYNYSSADCTQTEDDSADDLSFARYDGPKYDTKFNEKNDDNAYIGFMYGTPNSNTYAQTHDNINKSTILKNLEAWYDLKLKSYTDKLADTIWCNDKSTVKNVTVNELESADGVLNKEATPLPGLGYNKDMTLYGASNRLFPLSGSQEKFSSVMGPSLICPNDNDGGKLSKFTVDDTKNGNGKLDYKIGLLTVDEIVLAGTTTFQAYVKNNNVIVQADMTTFPTYVNNNYDNASVEIVLAGMTTFPAYVKNNYNNASVTSYLISNATGNYWTLSPAYFRGDGAFVWHADYDGCLKASFVDYYSSALRPAVSLKSATTISGGNGTASSPFVIN